MHFTGCHCMDSVPNVLALLVSIPQTWDMHSPSHSWPRMPAFHAGLLPWDPVPSAHPHPLLQPLPEPGTLPPDPSPGQSLGPLRWVQNHRQVPISFSSFSGTGWSLRLPLPGVGLELGHPGIRGSDNGFKSIRGIREREGGQKCFGKS
jgi:hypothetical protein